jgi:large subunit ribosomal protein L35
VSEKKDNLVRTPNTIREKINMPKIKTCRAAAKRFKRTGTGKYKFRKSHSSHILTKKTTKRKRSLRVDQMIDQDNMVAVRRLLPNG